MVYQIQIKQFIETTLHEEGLFETGIEGVKLFRVMRSVPCAPVVYEPSIVAIVSGSKEVLMDGAICTYDSSQYLFCPMSMPVQAGAHSASPNTPLCGVYISLSPRIMTELALEMENSGSPLRPSNSSPMSQAFQLADWDETFSEALLRLLQLTADKTDMAVLVEARLREFYYSVLRGQAGSFARQAFGVGNAIARSIAFVSSNLNEPVSIDDLADRAGMSRAVFHRKFKQATTMSPIQFVKCMRLNNAAMKISEGMNISQAALDVGYVSPSQFSREFKRLYGQSPKQWGEAHHVPIGIA